jgi:hypothetical protein
MSVLGNNSILQQVIGNKLNKLLTPQRPKGLLEFVGSDMARDIGTGLLAQSGYQTMPTSFGQSLGTAFQNAEALDRERRIQDFSELSALTSIYDSLQGTADEEDDSWKLIQSYALDRGIELSESQAKEVKRNVGTGNVIRISENTGTLVNTLDALLEPYSKKTVDKEQEQETIGLETGEVELKEENIRKKVKVIQNDFKDKGWNDIIFAANEIEKLIQDSKESGNIEGVGFIEGNLPNFLVGEEGKLNKAKIARLFNIELKRRSGAAVTEPELLRLQEEFGKGSFTTDQDFINAFNNYKRIFNNVLRQEIKGYDPKALSAWGGTFQIGDTTKEDQRERFL